MYENKDLTILGNVLTTVQDMCEKKPGKNYTVPPSVSVYAAERIQLSATSSTSPTSSSLPPSSKDSSSGLSKGAIAGIVLGALVAVILVLGFILLLLKRRKNEAKAADAPQNEENVAPMTLPPNNQYNPVPVAD